MTSAGISGRWPFVEHPAASGTGYVLDDNPYDIQFLMEHYFSKANRTTAKRFILQAVVEQFKQLLVKLWTTALCSFCG